MVTSSNNDFKGERIRHTCTCCCMPCICCFITAEKLLKGICVGILGILSCACFERSIDIIIPRQENDEIELHNLEEEIKDATN